MSGSYHTNQAAFSCLLSSLGLYRTKIWRLLLLVLELMGPTAREKAGSWTHHAISGSNIHRQPFLGDKSMEEVKCREWITVLRFAYNSS